MDKKVDYSKLPPEMLDKLAKWEQESPQNQAIKAAQTAATAVEEIKKQVAGMKPEMALSINGLEAQIQPLVDGVKALGERMSPDSPDYTRPIVEALTKLEGAITEAVATTKQDFKPNIKVAPAQVKVDAPVIDLSGIQKVLKNDIPAAFKQAIAAIPETPEDDYTPLIERLDTMLASLEDIAVSNRLQSQAPDPNPGLSKIIQNQTNGTQETRIVGPAVTVNSENNTFKDDFAGNAINDAAWAVTQGPASTTSYVVTGSQLQINADVTPNDYIVFTSKQAFTLPFRAQFIISASQRIANNNLYLELVNAAGTQVANLGALGAQPNVTQLGYLINGAVATTGFVVAQNQGVKATADTSVTINTTASFGLVEVRASADIITFGTRTVDNSGVSGNTATRNRTILDPGEPYFLQIRSVNGAVVPASPTTFNIEMVMIRDSTSFPVEIFGGQGDGNTVNGIPISALPTLTTVSTVTNGNLGLPAVIADQVSGAITTTTTSSTLTPTFGTAFKINVPVTAKSGTLPTLDIDIQESRDTGTNWQSIYQFPQIINTGSYDSPSIMALGNRYRYVQTVSGTTPSFTRAINRLQLSSNGTFVRQLIDNAARSTINVNSLNSTTSNLVAEAQTTNVQLTVSMGAITTTAPQFTIQASDDAGATWYNVGSALTSIASTTNSLTVNNVTAQLFRATVSLAGSGATKNYILLRAF